MIEIKDKKYCCGCTACANICPKNAIKMQADNEGFLYPNINMEKCINCHMCEKVCPYNKKVKKKNVPKGYVVQNINKDVLKESTSGGFFDALANYIIDNDGYVCGAILNDRLKVVHIITNKKTDIRKFRGSKYVQSDISNIYSCIKELLDKNKHVCFSGTPCQVIGLNNYLNKEYDNLITVDFCCRSVPSPLLFEKYKDFMQEKYKSQIENLYFRKKTYGYHHGTLRIVFNNGKVYNGSNRVDMFNKTFHSDKCSRPSCYNCIAKGIKRVSDFTIFDSWHPNKLNNNIVDNDKGYTNLLIQSKKGEEVFEKQLKKSFIYYEINPNAASDFTGGMLEDSIEYSKERENFYHDLNTIGFKKTTKKYIKISCKDKAIEALKKIIYKKNEE